jgi:hypothetical protein
MLLAINMRLGKTAVAKKVSDEVDETFVWAPPVTADLAPASLLPDKDPCF